MSVLAVIPARFASSRFPGKPLIDLKGKPMIQRVWEQASLAKGVSRVIVATDDRRIYETALAFGAEAMMTPEDCASGTDRIAYLLGRLRGVKPSLVLNVQGDEPLLPPKMLESLLALMKRSKAPMGTLCRPMESRDEYFNPNAVKVLLSRKGEALYFSRAPIPYLRDTPSGLPSEESLGLHVGLYAYRPDFLKRLARLSPTPLERQEKLEQLRVLEHGFRIAVAKTSLHSQAIDTPADARRVRALIS